MPNPALPLFSSQWLNAALMDGRGRAVADPARLEHIIERQLLRNSLSLDPHRARSNDRQTAFAEIASATAVMDDGRARTAADDVSAAVLVPMFELGER